MLTKNGKNLLTIKIQNSVIAARPLKTTEGSTYSPSSSGYYATTLDTMHITVGGSPSTPSVDDYVLGDKITTLTEIGTQRSDSYRTAGYDDNYIYNCTSTFKNNTNSSITVREVGIEGNIYTGYPGWKPALFAREVITPVTIDPGKTFTFSMTIG